MQAATQNLIKMEPSCNSRIERRRVGPWSDVGACRTHPLNETKTNAAENAALAARTTPHRTEPISKLQRPRACAWKRRVGPWPDVGARSTHRTAPNQDQCLQNIGGCITRRPAPNQDQFQRTSALPAHTAPHRTNINSRERRRLQHVPLRTPGACRTHPPHKTKAML